MSEKSPQKLDELFQQGSERYDFEYNPEAWEQMEDLLEKDDRHRVLWWWFSGLGLVLLIGGLWFSSNEPLLNTSSPQNIEHTQIPETILKERTDEIKASKKTRPIAKTLSTNKEPLIERSPITSEQTAIIQEDFITTEHTLAIIEHRNPINECSFLPLLSFGLVSPPSPIILPEVIFSKDVNNLHPTKKAQILMGLVVAGEVSAVHSRKFSSLDWKFGGQLAYRYKQKYSTSIGANYIRKKYNAAEGQYIPPRGFWTRMIAPQATSATTTVLEIPITVGYFAKGYASNGFYTNIGLTSFFMLREKYQYSYDLPDPDLIREWGTQNTNRHWFGIGQISVGYQYFSNPKTTLQVAPYVQIPLTGIGHGQVKLWSIGINMRMNFQI